MNLSAQISDGGFPPSFQYPIQLKSSQTATQIPVTFSVDDLKRVDEWQAAEGLAPPAVATLIDVALNPQNAGRWITLPGGEKVWQLDIQANGAIALMLYYSDFHIPEGGKLFLYNAEKTQILGAYTHRTHPSGGRFATEFVAGDDVTLEYVASPDDQHLRIEIEAVGYGYNHLNVINNTVSLRASFPCEVGVNCEEGDMWQSQKRSVCRMVQLIGKKSYLCSASLLNNTAQDIKPYILTAQHCSSDNSGLVSTAEDMLQWVFYFNYERSGCSSTSSISRANTMTGCRRVAASATNRESDGLLLLLEQPIPEAYNVYYNGWDRRDKPAMSGASLHHPGGDYMKISTYRNPATTYTFKADNLTEGGENAHWNVIFDETANGHGVTEAGSSGSPLFNENHLLVGSLTGGSSNCTETTGLNLYGKLSYHWDKYGQPMSKYLDPVESGAETLQGRYHGGAVSAPSGLQAVYEAKTVHLAWDPVSAPPLKYRIYDNGTRTGETTEPSFSVTPDPGRHEYNVSAVYDRDRESDFSNATLHIPDYKAPENIAVTPTTADKVAVLWTPPLYEQTIYWGSPHAINQVIIESSRRFYFGQLWDRENILPFHKKTVSAVNFIPVRGNSYEIYVSQGDRIFSRRVDDPSYGVMNTVPLAEPFVIDASRQMIVAIHVTKVSSRSNEYPAKCDGGPAVQGKGNLFSFDGQNWYTLYEEGRTDERYNINFFVSAIITSTEGTLTTSVQDETMETFSVQDGDANSPYKQFYSAILTSEPLLDYSSPPIPFPEVSGYNIYRNRTVIGITTASGRRYVDADPVPNARYQVSAQFGNDEGLLSSPLEVGMAGVVENAPGIYPVLFGEEVEIRGYEHVRRVEIYAADGRCCLRADNPGKQLQTRSLAPGLYFFRLHTGDPVPVVVRGIRK
jgi:hypothetical protein